MTQRINQAANTTLQQQYNPRTGNWLSDSKDILLKFLQDRFYQEPMGQGLFHFEPGPPGDMTYSTNEVETELIISDGDSLGTDAIGKRPALILTRGDFAYGNTSMDQLESMSTKTGTRKHTDLLSGTFVVNCISSQGLEAERLAVTVARSIRYYRRNLQRAGFFEIGNMIQVGKESPPGSLVTGDSVSDWKNVPVTFPVYYQEEWTVEQPDAKLLSKIIFRLRATFARLDGSLVYPDAVNSDGSINESSEGVLVQEWICPPQSS